MPQLTLLDGVSGITYRVDTADAVIGRDPSAALVVQGDGAPVVSGRHARFFVTDGHWWVEDIGSRNGTFFGGKRLAPGQHQRLSAGDEIGLGSRGPKLRVMDAVVSAFAATIAEPIPAVSVQTLMEPQTAPRPATPARAQHVRLVLRANDGKRLVAQGPDVLIGRSRECGICVEGDMALAVSRRHARVFYSGWKICIEDQGSRNGTWLNRKPVKAATILERGDAIEFGAGGPRLVVEDVALVEPSRRTETEMPPPEPTSPFISELPTPPVARPAFRKSNEKN